MISGSERGFSICALGRRLSVMFLQLLSSFARGCYFVTVAGTFAEGGTVTLVNDAAEVLATFPETGTTTVELPRRLQFCLQYRTSLISLPLYRPRDSRTRVSW